MPSGPRLIQAITKLVELCHSLGIPVLYTRHLNTSDDAGMMAIWNRKLHEDSMLTLSSGFACHVSGTQLMEELKSVF